MQLHDFIFLFTTAFVALFPVVNPIGDGFIINGFLKDLDEAERKAASKKILMNCLLIGLGSLVAGQFILQIFGLAIPAIQVGGGFLICKAGLEALSGDFASSSKDNQKEIRKITMEELEQKLFYPLSFPISVGGGTVSVIFTLVASSTIKGKFLHTGINYLIIALAFIVMLSILYVFLMQGTVLMKKLGKSGGLIINKLVAFITFCVGIQILVKGISQIFHLNIL
jgi:MarC family membrane protein